MFFLGGGGALCCPILIGMIIIIHEIGVRVYLTLPSSAWHHPFWLLDLSSGHIFCIPQIYPAIAIYWIYPLVPFGNQTWQRNIPSFWLIFPFQPPCIGDFPLPGFFFPHGKVRGLDWVDCRPCMLRLLSPVACEQNLGDAWWHPIYGRAQNGLYNGYTI